MFSSRNLNQVLVGRVNGWCGFAPRIGGLALLLLYFLSALQCAEVSSMDTLAHTSHYSKVSTLPSLFVLSINHWEYDKHAHRLTSFENFFFVCRVLLVSRE